MIAFLDEFDAVRAACRTMLPHCALMSAGTAMLPLPANDIAGDGQSLLTLRR